MKWPGNINEELTERTRTVLNNGYYAYHPFRRAQFEDFCEVYHPIRSLSKKAFGDCCEVIDLIIKKQQGRCVSCTGKGLAYLASLYLGIHPELCTKTLACLVNYRRVSKPDRDYIGEVMRGLGQRNPPNFR